MNDQLYPLDSNFQSQQSSKCDLLIHISSTRIAYAILDIVQEQIKVLFETPLTFEDEKTSVLERLDHMLDGDKRLKFHFRKTKFSIDTFKFTFIPQEIYSDKNLKEYTKFISPNIVSDTKVSHIKTAKIKNIFAIEPSLTSELSSRFNKPSIFSQANPFIEGVFKISKKDINTQLFLNVEPECFEAALLLNGKFHFYNFFDCRNADEFNYYLLAIIEQFGLNKTPTTITLSGQINENDDYYNRIQKYSDKVEFADIKHLISHPENFKNTSPHHYFSLISLNLCE